MPRIVVKSIHTLKGVVKLSKVGNFFSTYILPFGLKIVAAIILIAIGFAIVNKIKDKVLKKRSFKHLDDTAFSFMVNFISAAIKVLLVLTAIILIGVPSATVIAVLGSCGLAIGLALQGGLTNLAGGVLIMLLKPFKLGDYVNAGGCEGTVKNIGIFYTTLLTVDNKEVVVPNGSVTGGTVTNFSSVENRRIDLEFSVAASNDLDSVKAIFKGIADADERILKDPAPDIFVGELGAAYVKFIFRPWVKSADYWTLYFDITEKVRREFTEKGIAAPVEKVAVDTVSK